NPAAPGTRPPRARDTAATAEAWFAPSPGCIRRLHPLEGVGGPFKRTPYERRTHLEVRPARSAQPLGDILVGDAKSLADLFARQPEQAPADGLALGHCPRLLHVVGKAENRIRGLVQ